MTMIRQTIAATLAIGLLTAAGCRLPWFEGAVPQSLATSRHYSQLGATALEQGQRQKAEEYLARAVRACPSDPEARRHYAEALWQRGAGPQAVSQLEEAGQLVPEDANLQVRAAEMLLELGQFANARQHADAAIDLSPKLAAAWTVRGRIMRASGNPRQALCDCQHALALAPNDQPTLWETAELYRQLRQPERALQVLQSLADTYPSGAEPQPLLVALGLTYGAAGRHDDAVETLNVALQRQIPSPELLRLLAEAQGQAGRTSEAAQTARRALLMDPTQAASQELVARLDGKLR